MSNKTDNKPSRQKISEDLQELEHELKSLNPKVFAGINERKKFEILQSISIISIQEKMHSGPLPDADTLVKYNSVIPDGADRIIKMAEKQQDHRISIENKVLKNHSAQSKLGQIFGLIIGLIGIACGTYLAATGKPTVGGIIAGGTVISLVSVFVIGKSIQHKKTEE